jgi:hypothetical protein
MGCAIEDGHDILKFRRKEFVEQLEDVVCKSVWKSPFLTNTYLGAFDQQDVDVWTADVLRKLANPLLGRVDVVAVSFRELRWDLFILGARDEDKACFSVTHSDALAEHEQKMRKAESGDVDWCRMPGARKAKEAQPSFDFEKELENLLQESGLLQPHEEQSLRDIMQYLDAVRRDEQEAEAEADSESGTDDDHVVEAAEENVGCEAPW